MLFRSLHFVTAIAVCMAFQTASDADFNLAAPTGQTTFTTNDLLGIGAASSDLATELKQVEDAFRAGNIAECQRLLDELRSKMPSAPSTQVIMARLFMQAGNFGAAIERIERYLLDSPNDPAAFLVLADIAARSGRWTETALLTDRIEELLVSEKSLDLKAKESIRFEMLGRRCDSATQRMLYDIAEKCIAERIQMRPDDPVSYRVQGQLRVRQNQNDKALDSFKKAKELDGNELQAELAIALELAALSSSDAEAWFRKGVQAPLSSSLNWSRYFYWLLVNGRPNDVITYHGKVNEAVRNERDQKFLRGIAARMVDDIATAEKIFSELHQANPDDLESADQLALVLADSNDEGKRARAAQLSQSNFRRAPNVETIIATAAWVQFKLGEIDVADRLLGELASKSAVSPQTAYYVSEVLRKRGQSQQADEVLAVALKNQGILIQRAKLQPK